MPRDTEKNIEKLLEDCMHIGETYYWMIKEGKVKYLTSEGERLKMRKNVSFIIMLLFVCAIILSKDYVKASEEDAIKMLDYDLETGEITNWTFEGNPLVPDVHLGYAGTDTLPEVEARTVIGKDDRVVVNGKTSPYSYIGRIQAAFGEIGVFEYGTGFLVSPDTVITAASCVYSQTRKKLAVNATFIPGMSSNNEPYGNVSVKSIRVPADYKNATAPGTLFNFAILKLSSPIGNKCGYFSLKKVVDATAGESMGTWTISGYPYEASMQTNQVKASGNVLLSSNGFSLKYSIDTDFGEEGAPIFKKEGSNYSIAGINCLNLEKQNMGRYLTTKLYELIVSSL